MSGTPSVQLASPGWLAISVWATVIVILVCVGFVVGAAFG